MAGKVLVTDLDGTLFYPRRRFTMVCKKTKRFLKKWTDDGNRLVLCSSRGTCFASQARKYLEVPFDMIGGSGTIMEVDGKTQIIQAFEPEEFRALAYELIDSGDFLFTILTTADYNMVIPKRNLKNFARFMFWAYQSTQFVYREPQVLSDEIFERMIDERKALKLMMMVGLTEKKQKAASELSRHLQEKYPDFHINWFDQFIEITPKGCSKASGLAFYLDSQGISPDNVSVVGDSGNDVPMFRAHPNSSFCMEHAFGRVKREATHVIKEFADLEKWLYPSADSPSPEKTKGDSDE